MVNNYDKHVGLMTRNLRDLGLDVERVSEQTKEIIYTCEQPYSLAGKMFEDVWVD